MAHLRFNGVHDLHQLVLVPRFSADHVRAEVQRKRYIYLIESVAPENHMRLAGTAS